MASQFELEVLSALAKLETKSAVLESQVSTLLTSQAKDREVLLELVADKNKGKGALWMLVTIGGLVGAVLSNIGTVVSLFSPKGP